MKLPKILDEYLDETEQDANSMSKEEILTEAKWVLWECWNNPSFVESGNYKPQSIAALKRFVRTLQTES